jgi:fructokinase
MSFNITCFGEMLWDILPGKELPGGAPMNVAYHLQRLSQPVAMVSRLGKDDHGRRLLAYLQTKGLSTNFIQEDGGHETGKVYARLNARHEAEYDIRFPAAWDFVAWEPALEARLQRTDYLVFGSLAARHSVSRSTLEALLRTAAKKVLDINLRPPHYTQERVEWLLGECDILKLNEGELELIAGWQGSQLSPEEGVKALAARFGMEAVIVTMGGQGALLYTGGRFYRHPGYRVQVADTIGSGDAFLAGFLSTFIQGGDPERCLAFANAAGALVASREGACPDYEPREIEGFLTPSNKMDF